MLVTESNQIHSKGKPGRPYAVKHGAIAKESAQAVELSQIQWRELALTLAAQCQGFVKKKEPIPGQLLTQAAIAYDKAFSKADQTDTTLAIPPTLERAIVKALVSDNAHNVYQVPGAPVNTPSSETGSVTIQGQGQGHVADPESMPGVGLRSDSDAGAGAAYQALSPPVTEPENISENQKDQVAGAVDRAGTPGASQPTCTEPRQPRVLGPKRFVDPFKEKP
jgi:hypothetical protein